MKRNQQQYFTVYTRVAEVEQRSPKEMVRVSNILKMIMHLPVWIISELWIIDYSYFASFVFNCLSHVKTIIFHQHLFYLKMRIPMT